LGWIIWKAMAANAANVNWTIGGIVGVGIVLMIATRLSVGGAGYFATRREADVPEAGRSASLAEARHRD
jgi:hypothetical protein